jgi:glycosyltransferase involved in cell wall biosynthesis
MDKLSKKYDLLIFPTVWAKEGNPGVFIDAFCSGLPVVCSDWMDLKEFIKNGKNGILIKPNNFEDLYNVLSEVYKNLNMLTELRKKTLESAKDYHIENNLNPFIKNNF